MKTHSLQWYAFMIARYAHYYTNKDGALLLAEINKIVNMITDYLWKYGVVDLEIPKDKMQLVVSNVHNRISEYLTQMEYDDDGKVTREEALEKIRPEVQAVIQAAVDEVLNGGGGTGKPGYAFVPKDASYEFQGQQLTSADLTHEIVAAMLFEGHTFWRPILQKVLV